MEVKISGRVYSDKNTNIAVVLSRADIKKIGTMDENSSNISYPALLLIMGERYFTLLGGWDYVK